MNEQIIADILPDKPSELIELALKDLRAVEADPRYIVDMDTWHTAGNPYYSLEMEKGEFARREPCRVCLAGAVMSNTLKVPVDTSISIYDIIEGPEDRLSEKLEFLDNMLQARDYFDLYELCSRRNYYAAYSGDENRLPMSVKIVADYREDKEQFHKDMQERANDFKKVGL